ncbi:MAG: membrane protein [Rhodothalassiaceae bacterium]|nr:MAG: membrane protein [Rhodothalassiaceae bacterium]
MNDALIALAWTAALAGVLWLPYVLARIQAWGLRKVMDNPDPNAPALPDWANRAKAAHANLTENLVHFAALVLVAQIVGIAGAVATAAVVFFWARLAHAVIYILGIPVLRTLAFAVGWVAEVVIFVKVIQALYGG